MNLQLDGAVALVTAASRGIGRAVAQGLAEEGAHLAIAARSGAPLEQLSAEIEQRTGVRVMSIPTDLTVADEVDRFVHAAINHLGRADILVNVAGDMPPGRIQDLGDADWTAAFGLKFMATVRTSRTVLSAMRHAGSGVIINVAGGAGWEPLPHQLTQGAVNAALMNLTKGLSREVAAQGIRVNAVAPGPTVTDRFRSLVTHLASDRGISESEAWAAAVADIPDGRPAEPEEVAAAVTFLASPRASHINGVVLSIDGGQQRAVH